MAEVTSEQILNAAGIKAGKTLTRWHQRGLIPPPRIGTHPNGRGKMAYWPDWVLLRCRRIRDLVDAGKSLDEVSHLLGKDWEPATKTAQRRYRMRDALQTLDYQAAVQNFVDLVMDALLPMFSSRASEFVKVMMALRKQLAKRETVESVVADIVAGRNPVLIYDGVNISVVPDFIACQLLADDAGTGQTRIVKSVFLEARSAFAKILDQTSDLPSVRPVARVQRGSAEYEVHRVGQLDYELVEVKDATAESNDHKIPETRRKKNRGTASSK